MIPKVHLTWQQCRELAKELHLRAGFFENDRVRVYGVPRGGSCVALLVPNKWELVETPEEAELIVDDIIGSGATKAKYAERFPATPFGALVTHNIENPEWYVFPWEKDEPEGGEENVRRLLQLIGEDPNRNGLLETPSRFVKAFAELTSGTLLDPTRHLHKVFDLDEKDGEPLPYDCGILSRKVPFVSMCEHHLLPFFGVAHIGYIPNCENSESRVVGLSKLARMFDEYARRLQVQERLTMQAAHAIDHILKPRGVAIIVKGTHTCQCFRGVKKDGDMVTSAMLGCFRTEPETRSEFISLLSI